MATPATLSELTTDAGPVSPGFTPARHAYALRVPYARASLSVSASTAAPGATLDIAGQRAAAPTATACVPLAVGRNALEIGVVGEPGAPRYRLTVVRDQPTPDWVQATAGAPFAARDSAGEMVWQDRMWLCGGYTPELVSDVWSSTDGQDWRAEAPLPAPAGINIPLTWVFDGRMWVSSNDGSLYASADGRGWQCVCTQTPWQGRYAPGAAVFCDRMWAVGGLGQGRLWNDVWWSVDGRHWTCQTPAAPWSPRQVFSMLVVHRERLWLLGGGITQYHPFRAYRDVWSTADGEHWEQETEQAPWPARIWSSAVSWRDRLWVFSGFRSEPQWTNLDDVWYSVNGRDWQALSTPSRWSPRHEVSPYVHAGRLWVVAGNAWPLQRDAWYLDLPGLCFLSQPPVEEFSGAYYAYRAHADFGAADGPVRYRLIEAPPWLTVDAARGWVRGLAGDPGAFPVVLEAIDSRGATARQQWVVQVLPVG